MAQQKYADSILNMLKHDEGFVGQNEKTRKSAHKLTQSDYGAYYDSKGYLTTGYGELISKGAKGSEQEAKDLEKWKAANQFDPFNLTEEQASGLLPAAIDRNLSTAKAQLGADVDFHSLPEQAQQAIVSLSYNAGQIGNNTAAAIRKANETKSTADWQKVAKKFENWHGNLTADQPAGVIARRKREADLVSSIAGLFPEGSDFFTTLTRIPGVDDIDNSIPDGQLSPQIVNDTLGAAAPAGAIMDETGVPAEGRGPTSEGVSTTQSALPQAGAQLQGLGTLLKKDQLPPAGAKFMNGQLPVQTPEDQQPVPQGNQYKYINPRGEYSLKEGQAPSDNGGIGNDGLYQNPDEALNGSGFSRIAYDERQAEAAAARLQADKPVLDQLGEFKDHLANSFLVDNIVGSSIRKGLLVWNVESDYQNGFDATQLPSFKEEVQNIPPDALKNILDESYNPAQFYGRVANFRAETEAREGMMRYMADNPVSGFVGVGVTSIADVTSLIPVGAMARAVGMSKAAKGIPILARTIGANIAEPLIQQLVQDTYITANSDVRKFDDGDILYGAVAASVLGGAAGVFKYSKGLTKFEKLAQKFTAEKNIASLEMLVRKAETQGYSPKIVSNLKQMLTFSEQELERAHRAMVLKEIGDIQDRVGRGLIDTDKVEMVKATQDYNVRFDEAVAAERAKKPSSLIEFNEKSKAERSAIQEPANIVREEQVALKRRLRQLEANPNIGQEGRRQISNVQEQIAANEAKLADFDKQLKSQAKAVRAEKNSVVRELKRNGDAGINEEIQMLTEGKEQYLKSLRDNHDSLVKSVLDGSHPELQAIKTVDSVNEIIQSLGIEHLNFKNTDDLDRFLGMAFEDSEHFLAATEEAKHLSAAGTRNVGFLKGRDTDAFFNKTDGELWNVMSNSLYESKHNPAMNLGVHQVAKNSNYARILRATRLNELLTNESVVGRWIMNKGTLRSSNNEFANSFYNLFAPDGIGRAGEGRLSVIEKQQQLMNIYGGTLRSKMNEGIRAINAIALENPGLRQFLDLPENNMAARLQMAEVGWTEQVADKLLREELINPGTARQSFGDDIGAVIEKMANDFDQTSKEVLAHAKRVEVKGVDEIVDGAPETKGWFHRTWDNKAVRQFHAKYGEDKLVELVNNSMVKNLSENGVEMTDDLIKETSDQAKKFAFGIFNSDLEVNKAAKLNAQDFIDGLINKGLDVEGGLQKEADRLAQRAENAKARELGKRKPLSLDGAVTIADESGERQFFMKDLLEKNVLASQKNYLETMSARISAAEAGIKDVDLLDQWVNNAHELEMNRGNVASADYIKRSMNTDIKAFKYGSMGVSGELDQGTSALLRMAKKYQFARLMQYTGISSIAEMGILIPEAGYKAVSQAITQDLGNVARTMLFGGFTGKEFTNALYDGLSSITGVGLEDIGYDSLISSSNMIATSKYGQIGERIVDNAAKATRRATSHIEVTGRRLMVNSLALNFGDIAFGRSRLDNLMGGLSNRNLVELGLADLNAQGRAVTNAKWDAIVSHIKKHATDQNGKLVAESGGNIHDFNIHKWDLETRRVFGDALTQQANHIMVNPDSTTAKLWTTTPIGSVFNQFRTFANNAAVKVAGHNVNQAVQGYKMGSMAEFSKTAQKYFWGAALGKLSLMLYGSINEAGRPDYSKRMEKYIHMDSPRDWTRALGRSSAVTGLDDVLDTGLGAFGVEPLFNSSTIGQSRNRFDLMNTPTGQMLRDASSTANYTIQGLQGKPKAFQKAGKTALKMSPIRRQLGVNQLLNSMGVD